MNYHMVRYVLGWVLRFMTVFFLLPAIVGAYYGEVNGFVYLGCSLGCLILSLIGGWKKPDSSRIFAKEGFAAVALSWILISLVGAIPFVITGEIPSYLNAVFETISGFTTTGSSIITNLRVMSHCSLFWRSFTHWVGGMGVLVFIMAVLPLSGRSSMHMMKAESPGPSVSKLVPKATMTARYLYAIYCGITILEMILLMITGLTPFEASTLTFGTVGTGGFGLLSTSIQSYNLAAQIIITVFMIICSINFSVYYLLLIRKPKLAFFNEEVRWFFIMLIGAAIVITINIHGTYENIFLDFHHAMFTVAATASTTGYAVADFNVWPALSKILILLLMIAGACAGSTGGGFKMSRILICVKTFKNSMFKFIHPNSVRRIKLNNKIVEGTVIKQVLAYLAAYVAIAVVSIILISFQGRSIDTNISAVLATFNNIGPGLDGVGPTASFADYNAFSKIVLMFDMLVGRLEIFPMLILFMPSVWAFKRKKKKEF